MQSAIVVVVVVDQRTEMLMKECRLAKIRESHRRQRQSGAAENRAAGLTARRCDVGLTLPHRRRHWYKACIAGYTAAVWAYYRHILTYNDRTVTHLHIKWGVAVGSTVVGAGRPTRHLPPSRIHAPVTNRR